MSPADNSIRVILADNQQLFRYGFERLIESYPDVKLLGVSTTGSQVLSQVQVYKPDVVITEHKLDDINGVELTRNIVQQFPEVGVVVLSMESSKFWISKMLEAGALGFVLKSSEGIEVICAIRAAAKGDKYYCRQVSEKIRALKASRRIDPLTMQISEFSPTEIRILQMIAQELDTYTISNTLRLSVPAIKKYRRSILQKTGVNSIRSLINYAKEKGYLEQ